MQTTRLAELAGLIISITITHLLILGSLHTQEQRITILLVGVFLASATMAASRYQAAVNVA